MSLKFSVSADPGVSKLALSNNIKLAISLAVFFPTTKLVTDSPTLELSTEVGHLIEPNAIVKYLAFSSKKDLTSGEDKAIYLEEIELYNSLLKSNSDPTVLKHFTDYFKSISVSATSISQIILFSSFYVLFNTQILKIKESYPDFANWYKSFSSLPEVISAFKSIKSLLPEPPKQENTGVRNLVGDFQLKQFDGKIVPKSGERNILITSALPYVNNVPHLGNIIGSVLSADFYARYAKARNYNTLYVCGTDEYGTATETKALEEGVTPRQLCDKYNAIHEDIYKWFQIGFDYFGRTTTDYQTEIAQDMFLKLNANNYLEEKTTTQLFCEQHKGFLADRYVEGICPKCSYEDARGDQCDGCGTLLNPFELVKPRCKLDGSTPIPRDSNHVFFALNKLEDKVKEWVEESYAKGKWSRNGKSITDSWLKEGLKSRCITRDLVWGTPVPLENFKDKVMYVWFDACIGYVSITANYTEDWQKWWKRNDDDTNVQLYQFMGKDNVPFHTVIFPATQIGTGEKWTQLHHISTTEYLQYEGGKFSKSRGIGVFGNSAKDSGIPPSVWRYYLATARPETSDTQFSWQDFVNRNNGELLANVGNFVNRLVKFVNAKYNGVVPAYNPANANFRELETDVNKLLQEYNTSMEAVHIRKGLEHAMAISSRGNVFLQSNKLDNSLYANEPERAAAVIAIGLNLIYLVSAVLAPFMPETSEQIVKQLNVPLRNIPNTFDLPIVGGHCIGKPSYLFSIITEKQLEEFKLRYGGNQEK